MIFHSIERSTLFLVAASLFGVTAIQDPRSHRAVPLWLVVPALLFLFAACLIELFPYSPHSVRANPVLGAVQPTGTADTNLTGLLKLEAATFLIPLVVFFATTRARVEPLRGLVLFAQLWMVSATISALVAALDALGITAVETALLGEVDQGARVYGLTTHPNRLGLMSAMSLPIALYFLAEARRVRKGLYAAALGVLSFAIIVSGSRAALLAGALMVVCLLVVSPSIRRTITPLALSIGAMALASTLVVSTETSDSALARLGPGSSSAARSDARREVVHWEAVRQVEARPLTA